MLNRQRTVGSKTALCTDPTSLGRIVIGGCMNNEVVVNWYRTTAAYAGCSHALVPTHVCLATGLYGRHLPITVSNFRSAVQQGLYTGTIFHKVLPGAFVQVK
jgi:Cyclophilin type peptidyl-prolyl cis-trans isomerase/CLD